MRLYFLIILLLYIVPVIDGQDLFETGELVIDSDFNDFDPGPLNPNGINVIGVFDDIPGNDTGCLEIDLPGGTEIAWNELLQTDIERPENSEEVYWRVQYRIYLENVPYDIQTRMQITEEPWSGFSLTNTIPEGYEEKWIFFDFVADPFANFTTEMINFSLRFGAQQPQFMHIDDIRLYESNALGVMSFESRADDRIVRGIGVEVERIETEEAQEGFHIINAVLEQPGTSLGDATITLNRILPRNYSGAFRLTMNVKSNVAPLEIRAGLTDTTDLSDLIFSQDNVMVEEKDQWVVKSFLIPPFPGEVSRIIPFIQFGGQSAVQIQLDRAVLLKTDEEVEPPVIINNWEIY